MKSFLTGIMIIGQLLIWFAIPALVISSLSVIKDIHEGKDISVKKTIIIIICLYVIILPIFFAPSLI